MAANKEELRALLRRFEDAFTGEADLDLIRAWLPQLHTALRGAWPSDATVAGEVARLVGARFRRGLRDLKKHHRLRARRFSPAYLGPEAIAERYRPLLAERIRASAELIRLNRDEEIERQLRRFAGWATGALPGQARRPDRGELERGVTKALHEETFVRRRVCIDQGHKLLAAVDDAIAAEHGAIAKRWRHVIPHAGYQSREEHLKRDGTVYAVRGNSMLEARRMRKAGRPYADELEDPPAFLPYCSCWWEAIYDLGDLPDDMRS